MRVESSRSHQELHIPTMSTAYKTHAPTEIATLDEDYDYSVATPLSPEEKAFQDYKLRGEPPPPPPPPNEGRTESEDALLDLAQLEELHLEAERMKALGNKHMAAQVRMNTMHASHRHMHILVPHAQPLIATHLHRNIPAPTMPIRLPCSCLPSDLRRTYF